MNASTIILTPTQQANQITTCPCGKRLTQQGLRAHKRFCKPIVEEKKEEPQPVVVQHATIEPIPLVVQGVEIQTETQTYTERHVQTDVVGQTLTQCEQRPVFLG